jgi:hypothetical protein
MEESSAAKQGALATCLALRASLPSGCDLRSDVVLLLPELRPLSRTQLCEELVRLPKPLSCIAVETRGMMAVGVWHRPSQIDGWPEFNEMLQMTFADSLVRRGEQPYHADVRLQGVGRDTLTLTFAECEQWLTEYEFPLADFNVAPERDESRVAALCVISFRPSIGGRLDSR